VNPRIEELQKRLQREPGSRLFAQLAEELRKDGDVPGAIKVCREGLAKHPAYPSAHMTLGRALLDAGDFGGARTEFESVLRGAPDNILASRFLGEALEGLGDLPEAISRFKATLAMAPGDRTVASRLEALQGRTHPSGKEKPIPLAQAEESFEIEGPELRGPAVSSVRPLEAAEPVARVELGSVEALDFSADTIVPTLVPDEPEPTTLAMKPEGGAASGGEGLFDFEGPIDVPDLPPIEVEPDPLPVLEAAPVHEANLSTPTLAELYFNQGFADKAIEVYKDLLRREPGNTRAAARIVEIEALEQQLREPPAAATPVVHPEPPPPPATAAPPPPPPRVVTPPAPVAPPAPVPEPGPAPDPRALRRAAIERTIARLEQLRASLRRA
jgi:tetratricopeptide (TPR) repeat protein